MMGISALLLVVTNAWFLIPHVIQERQAKFFVAGNVSGLTQALRIPRSVANILTLNPFEIVRHPFNNTWIDLDRRNYFLEFFLKSAFFGEWNLGEHLLLMARIVLILVMSLLPFAIIGLRSIRVIESKVDFPMVATLASVLFAQIVWLWNEPYSCVQDFRYLVISIIPIAYLVVEGLHAFNRWAWIKGTVAFAALNCSIFLLMVCFL
jgi:hypothetical protein